MDTNELLLTLAWVSNRSTNQTKQLFELCDQNFEKLLQLEAYHKRTHKFACPSDKASVEEQLEAWRLLREEDRKRSSRE